MLIPPRPEREAERLARLRDFGVLDTLPEQAFEDITALASSICGTPMALISLIDEKRQWFKSVKGMDTRETDRDMAFCAHAILQPYDMMEVPDAQQDWRFKDNPLVMGAPNIRFYAGMPITTPDGLALGTVCVADREARQLTDTHRSALQSLASLVLHLLERDRQHKEHARREAAEAERRLEYLSAASLTGRDLMAFVDPGHVYRFANATYLDYWGRTREDLVGRPVAEVMGTPQYEALARGGLDQALAGRQASFESTIDFPGQGSRHVETTYVPARNDAGDIIGVVVRTHDIHTLKLREEQLRASVSLLEHKTLEQQRFIHIISHDLREPINSISNFSGLLMDDHLAEFSPATLHHLQRVHAGGERMKASLDDLMRFVQLEQHAVSFDPVDIGQLMQQVHEDLSHAIAQSGGRLDWAALPTVQGDRSLLRVLLQNLVANGLKFSRPGVAPRVEVNAERREGEIRLTVQDNGIGIAASQLDNIFDMFKRLHPRKRYQGTGLGLSIARRIAELHGGQVRVTSEPEVGSRFCLILPDTPPSTAQEARP
ncbi:sensor histidine kinase [Hydrogenophaga sp.]|uniref:sensor histidine kinase n=1 Tax=Hydrogenophaga sp. TaxID=1904254 RepID=UPI00286DB11F|nr:ATP-binding protein [Hydrogenophaga sp.]